MEIIGFDNGKAVLNKKQLVAVARVADICAGLAVVERRNTVVQNQAKAAEDFLRRYLPATAADCPPAPPSDESGNKNK